MAFSSDVPARVVFGENLRRARVGKGLSQEALGEISGVHRTFVGAIERAENNVSIDSMERLAAAVQRSLSELLDYKGLPE
jgi:transcriptional regulator with XRE-family HTH domain